MKTILKHIEAARTKPHHVRKRIVFATAGVGAAFVALVWFSFSITTGLFAIHASNFAESGAPASIGTTSASGGQGDGLAGAAAVIPPADVPAHIEIVDTHPAAAPASTSEQTTIPF